MEAMSSDRPYRPARTTEAALSEIRTNAGVLYDPDGFAKIFLYRPADYPSNAAIYGEYLGWSQEQDANYHVDIQLYQ